MRTHLLASISAAIVEVVAASRPRDELEAEFDVCISESLVILARLYDEQAKASAPKHRNRSRKAS